MFHAALQDEDCADCQIFSLICKQDQRVHTSRDTDDLLLALLLVLLLVLGGFSGPFSKADTVYKTPANGENNVLTHISKRV